MNYSIQAYKNGECVLKGKSAFKDHDPDGNYKFFLYVYVVRNGDRNIVVDTGPKDLVKMNEMVQHILVEPIVQQPDERTESIIHRAGLDFDDVDAVFITHFHYDHCSNVDLFPNAEIVVSKRGFEAATDTDREKPIDADKEFIDYLLEVRDRVVPVEEGEIIPGITTFWAGGHTISSQAYVVESAKGSVVFASDSIFLYKNLELGIPIGVGRKTKERIWSMNKLKNAGDILLPGHDPEIMKRFPGGMIA